LPGVVLTLDVALEASGGARPEFVRDDGPAGPKLAGFGPRRLDIEYALSAAPASGAPGELFPEPSEGCMKSRALPCSSNCAALIAEYVGTGAGMGGRLGWPDKATPAVAALELEEVGAAVAVGDVRPEGASVPSVNTVSMLRDRAIPLADPSSGGGVGPRAPKCDRQQKHRS
jgi:hypothetical protein